MRSRYSVITNLQSHLVVDRIAKRCLGGFGSNYCRCWVFPLYTPSGRTVLQEYAHDHPFHNGLWVGHNRIIIGDREANFWAVPPPREAEDWIFTHVGRAGLAWQEARETSLGPKVDITDDGVTFTQDLVWYDENEQPVLDETRVVRFESVEDATICDMISTKTAAYGTLHFPIQKFGSIAARIEPSLLPPLGGIVVGDAGRRGNADIVHEQESDFVAYEQIRWAPGPYGIYMTVPGEPSARGPWFVRDFGLTMYHPTLRSEHTVPKGESWTVKLRAVAYDGLLTNEKAENWRMAL